MTNECISQYDRDSVHDDDDKADDEITEGATDAVLSGGSQMAPMRRRAGLIGGRAEGHLPISRIDRRMTDREGVAIFWNTIERQSVLR